MKEIYYIIQKEFLQIKRNKAILPVIFLMPILQMFVLVWATTMELKEVHVGFIDKDNSVMSRRYYSQINQLDCFICKYFNSRESSIECLHNNKLDVVIEMPMDLEKHFLRGEKSIPQISINAVNSNNAEMIRTYLDNEWQVFVNSYGGNVKKYSGNHLTFRYWYNSQMDFKHYMAPGILAILVSLVGMMLSGMNFVREKELGTIEQINVTPIKKYQLVIGKFVPFLIIGIVDLLLGILIAKMSFSQPIRGNIFTLVLATAIYLLPLLGISLLISVFSDKQQQVMFVGFFFLLIFILTSGLFTPVESMPRWAQMLNYLNPMFFYIRIIRGILIKGASIADIYNNLIILFIYGISMFVTAIYNYKKVI